MDQRANSPRTAQSPTIPPRTSSKRAFEDDARELKEVKKEAKRLRKSIDSLNRYVDPTAWYSAAEDHMDSLLEICELDKKLALEELRVNNVSSSSEEGRSILLSYTHLKLDLEQQKIVDRRQKQRQAELGVEQLAAMGVLGAGPSGELGSKLLLELDERPAAHRRSKSDQSAMRTNTIDMYESLEPNGEGLWCPIVGRFLPSSQMRAAHIFPYRLGSKVMALCFGKSSADEIMSPKNCLMVSSELETKFDQYLLVIVPVTDAESSTGTIATRWQTRILDHGCESQPVKGTGLTWGELDKRELVFRSDYRPAARYLYFHYVMSLLYAMRLGRKGWAPAGTTGEKMWATPGPYLRASMLRALALHVGHDTDLPPGCDEHIFSEEVPDQEIQESEAAQAMVLLPPRGRNTSNISHSPSHSPSYSSPSRSGSSRTSTTLSERQADARAMTEF
ncbi:MAG: hypothetical protein M1826_007671 [Phylliscum demangeonii]|nr:MAG: hypothetical protein M1826_007671 [Phylliscum demangeonii]